MLNFLSRNCDMGLRGMAVAVALLYLSLAICVLGRPQPNPLTEMLSASQTYPTGSAAERSSPHSYSLFVFGFRLPRLRLLTPETPFKQERRFLKGSGGRGGRSGGYSVGGGGGGGGGGGENTTVVIIVIFSIVAFLLLLVSLLGWRLKKRENPNWRLRDCFKRKKPVPPEKYFTSVKKDVGPDAAEHNVTVDGPPRMDHAAKSRKQSSLSHDLKTTSSSK